MSYRVLLNLLAIIFLMGCASTPSSARMLTRSELQQKFADTAQLTAYWEYMGDQDGYHFFRLTLASPFKPRFYRVAETEFPIKGAFPLTDDPTRWLLLKSDGSTTPRTKP